MKKVKPQPSPEQLQALQAFADKKGRSWKQALSDAWMNGSDDREPNGHLLRQLRNQFGPSWLATYKPSTSGEKS